MREIKFRAWDRKNRVMIPFTESSICDEYSLLAWAAPEGSEYYGIDSLPDWNKHDERESASKYYDIEQFTGLHDKNGKEIYEGDLILNSHGRICEVVWHGLAGCWDALVRKIGSDGVQMGFQTQNWPSCVEVIGNVHENPELLK